jgi:hypothetical protein
MGQQRRRHWIVSLLAAALVSGCGGAGSQPAPPSTGPAETLPATASAAPAVEPTASVSLDPGLARLEGTWSTGPVAVDDVLATIRSSDVSDDQFAAYYRAAGAETVTFKLRFLGDQMAWIEVLDDRADEVGAAGPYWIEDGDTIVFPDTSGPGQVRVAFAIDDGTLSTSADPDAQTTADRKDPMALAAVAAWFNSAPYIRQSE